MNYSVKTFSNTFLYTKGDYEKRLIDFIILSDRIDKKDQSFEDIKYQVKRRQVTNILSKVLDMDQIVLMINPVSLPKSFKVFAAKDIKTDKNLKIFIDCTDILKNTNGTWVVSNIDILIAHLVSAITTYMYIAENNRMLMSSDIAQYGVKAFSTLFTNIIDYIYKISLLESKRDICVYLSSMYYMVNILGKNADDESTISLCKKISNISDRQISIINMGLTSDSYSNINNFIKTVAFVLKINKLNIDNFVEKWIFLYGTGTQFGLEYFPSFASILTNAYVGCYINNQKTIEKIVGGDLVDFTKTIFRLGEGVLK